MERVNKELIPQFTFVKEDVLTTDELIQHRMNELQKAMIYGNTYKGKVSIVFETIDGPKCVETTIWHAGEKNIMLKGGVIIPIRCIKEIIF
jgi:hypothetical protein